MKIKSLVIENLQSFRDQTRIAFDSELNIFVGPNGGGKSNLLDILTVLIRGLLIKSYRVSQREERGLVQTDIEHFTPFSNINQHKISEQA